MNRVAALLCITIITISTVGFVPSAAATPTADSGSTCEYPISKVDATGTTVTIRQQPDKVVTLAPSAAQTVWEIGGADQVVGITEYATYLEGSSSKAIVGAYNINIEAVVGLTPDLVLAPNTVPDQTVSKLRNAGVKVYKFRAATSIDFIAEKTLLTGELIGRCQAAQERTAHFRQQVNTIEEAVQGKTRPTVVHILGESGYAAGRETFINKIIQKSGGSNIAADSFAGYQSISTETVLAENPQWITRPRSFPLSTYAGTTAVEQNQVITLNENYISQPAPRIVIPMVKLVKHWHPDAYQQAQLSEISSGSDTSFGPTAYSSSMTENGAALLAVTNFRYREQQVANFTVPTAFENRTNPELTTVEVEPAESNFDFEITVTKLDENVTLPSSAEPLAGYGFSSQGMWSKNLATLSITAELNTTEKNISAADIVAYRKTNGNWTRTEVTTKRTNSTLQMRANVTEYTAVYFARTSIEESVTETTMNITEATQTATKTPETEASIATSATPTESTPTAQQTATTEETPTTTAATGPGFGIIATMLTLLGLGLLQARQRGR